jgi:hypothetical protein
MPWSLMSSGPRASGVLVAMRHPPSARHTRSTHQREAAEENP